MRLLPLLLVACYTPPDLDTVPWEAPVLTGEDTPVAVCAPGRPAQVTCAIDGDTVDVGGAAPSGAGCPDDAERIRLLGIDAPETEKVGQEGECWAEQAARELSRITLGRRVTLTFDRECTDVYGRTLAYVWLDRDDAYDVLRAEDVEDVLRIQQANGPATELPDGLGETDAAEAAAEPVMVNLWLLVGGFARRFDEDWVEPLRWEAEMISAERLAEVRRTGLQSACPPE